MGIRGESLVALNARGCMCECVGVNVRYEYECVQAGQTRTCTTNRHLM